MIDTATPQTGAGSEDGAIPHMDMATFLMASAHDMKNSLSVMVAYLEDALREMEPAGDETGDASGATDMTHQALYEAQRLNDHLIQILAIYKMDEGLYPFDPTDVELALFAEEAIARVRPLAQARGIALEMAIDASERSGYFDHELILNVVVQALHNAIKYTRDRVRLTLTMVDGPLDIRVMDNGKGFPPFMLGEDFPRRQGVNFHTGSTGLGLHFSRLAARMHRNRGRMGHTRLENSGALGGGSFVLTLP